MNGCVRHCGRLIAKHHVPLRHAHQDSLVANVLERPPQLLHHIHKAARPQRAHPLLGNVVIPLQLGHVFQRNVQVKKQLFGHLHFIIFFVFFSFCIVYWLFCFIFLSLFEFGCYFCCCFSGQFMICVIINKKCPDQRCHNGQPAVKIRNRRQKNPQ